MDRRTFVSSFAGVLWAASVTCLAQRPAKIWRIGFLVASARQSAEDGRYDAFVQSMRSHGYVERDNLVIEWRFADGNYDRLPALAAELVRLKVDLIVATPSPAIRAAQQATTTIPIVFPNTGDPVGSGFAASLARPGGNLTGLSNANLDVSAKTLELLTAVAPGLSRIAVLGNPRSSTESAILKSIEAAGQNIGVRIVSVEVTTPEEIERGFANMRRDQVEAVVVAADAFINMQRHQIAELALKYRLPSISQGLTYAKSGGLMSYGSDTIESYRRAAAYVDKILKGAKPADLPVERPTKLALAINLTTAKALGLTIPQTLLVRADEVIQ